MAYKCEIVKGTNGETILEAFDDIIKVEFAWIGEGWSGDYNENDEEDERLIRFYIYIKNPNEPDAYWEEIDDTSYCTQLSADEPIEYLEEKIKEVFNRYRDVATHILTGGSVKKMSEELSWIG